MPRQYRDEIAMVCHDMMKAGQSIGAVSDSEMKEFEADCFVKESKTASEVDIPAAAGQYSHVTA